jgi:hypothetical protein
MNRNLIGWIVAAVLAVALGGVLIYEAASDDDGSSNRKAALSSGGQQGLPSQVSADANQIQDQKETPGNHALPELGADQEPTRLQSNPPQRCNPGDEPNVFAEWRNNPESLDEAGTMADEIVVGTARSTHKGTPFSVNVSGEPNNPQVTPVQDVTFDVDQSIKGDTTEGGDITVQRLGDAAGCFRVAGDGAYQQGQRYLLLLENGAGARPPHTISPEGRYMVRANNTLQSVPQNDFGEDVDGQKLSQVVSKLKSG